jgi:hypothetical protein
MKASKFRASRLFTHMERKMLNMDLRIYSAIAEKSQCGPNAYFAYFLTMPR